MIALWYGFIVIVNALFLLTNGWKALFTYHPGAMTYLGIVIGIIHLSYFVPRLISARRAEAVADAVNDHGL